MHVRILCVDEADVLLTGSHKEMTWNILEVMRQLYHSDMKKSHRLPTTQKRSVSTKCGEDESSHSTIHRQIIFTAATLPSGGPQSVHAQLMRWVPKNTLFYDTDITHQVIPMAQMRFIDIWRTEGLKDEMSAKFEQLTIDLLSLRDNLSIDNTSQNKARPSLPKILLFANTVASAEEVFSYLEKVAEERTDVWWKGKVGKLHKQSSVNPEEKEKTLSDFRTGRCRVLVSTDLASRGLDLPDVTAVIQVEFPGNSADFLHRAGRTARAGKSGTGTCSTRTD